MALNGLYRADVLLSNYSLTIKYFVLPPLRIAKWKQNDLRSTVQRRNKLCPRLQLIHYSTDLITKLKKTAK